MADSPAWLSRQFETSWALAAYHLEDLTTAECLWRPADAGPHVRRMADGTWVADWPEQESYDLGPASIAWLTWHLIFWWSMLQDHAFGAGRLRREDVAWPGDAEGVRDALERLRAQWQSRLGALDAGELDSPARSRWPVTDRPFGEIVAWANLELMKNAAEIGYARFLYARRATAADADLHGMTPAQLVGEVTKLRNGIRAHRDSTTHELCWHHPQLWGLLPERTDPQPAVPSWPEFLRGCVHYRQSLGEQLPDAPRTDEPYRD